MDIYLKLNHAFITVRTKKVEALATPAMFSKARTETKSTTTAPSSISATFSPKASQGKAPQKQGLAPHLPGHSLGFSKITLGKISLMKSIFTPCIM